jgi:hypothetical protein
LLPPLRSEVPLPNIGNIRYRSCSVLPPVAVVRKTFRPFRGDRPPLHAADHVTNVP